MTNHSGFTMIELLITISVAGVLLALSIPSFREISLNNQRAARANELVRDLVYARSQAVGLQRPVVICRTASPEAPTCGSGSGWEEGWAVFVDSGATPNGAYDAGETLLRRHETLLAPDQISKPAAQRFTLRGNQNVAVRVNFTASGTTANIGTLVACDSRNDFTKARAISISISGRAQSFDTYQKQGAGSRDPRLASSVTTCQR